MEHLTVAPQLATLAPKNQYKRCVHTQVLELCKDGWGPSRGALALRHI
jgi:hypothetical protein